MEGLGHDYAHLVTGSVARDVQAIVADRLVQLAEDVRGAVS